MFAKSEKNNQSMNWSKKPFITSFTTLLICFFSTATFGAINVISSAGVSAIAQNAISPVVKLNFETNIANDYVESITITNSATNYKFNTDISGKYLFKRVSIYEDNLLGDNVAKNTFSSDDLRVAFHDTFNGTTSDTLTFTFTGSTIPSENRMYFIVYEMNEEIDYGEKDSGGNYIINHNSSTFKTDITVDEITTSQHPNPTSINFPRTGIPITGLSIKNFSNNLQTKVFPGQTLVPVTYFTLAGYGENISNINISVFNEDNSFDITDDEIENGIQNVFLYKSSFTNNEPALETNTSFNIGTSGQYSSKIDEKKQNNFTSSDIVKLDSQGTLDLTANTRYGFWILYDIGDNISVTQSTTTSFQIYDIEGYGEDSKQTVRLTTSNMTTNEFDIVALTVDNLQSEITNDFYGAYDKAPISSFYLQSINSDAAITQINIKNTGTIPFATNNEASDVQHIYLYADNGDDTFSITTETLIGQLALGTDPNKNTNALAKVPVDNLSISQNIKTLSYNDNNEEKVYIVYEFGSTFTQPPGNVGNNVNSAIGSITVSSNYEYYFEKYNVSYKATGVSDDNPLSLPETDNLTLVNTNVSVLNVEDLTAPQSHEYEGQTKIPMLKVDLHSDQTYSGTYFQLINDDDNFTDDITSGVKRIWAYLDSSSGNYPNNNTFDENDDRFLTSSSTWECPETNTFLKSSNCTALTNIEIPQGFSTLYILYSAGQESTNENFRMELDVINSDTTTLVTGGNLPAPQIAASISIQDKIINSQNISLEVTQNDSYPIDNAKNNFDIDIDITNPSNKNIRIIDVKPKIYSSSINGLDISYEFESVKSTGPSLPNSNFTGPGDTFSISYRTKHETQFTSGKGYVDVYIEYETEAEPNKKITFERYFKSEWKMAATNSTPGLSNTDLIEIDLTKNIDYTTELPPYIDPPLEIYREGKSNFLNGSAVQKEDIIVVTLKDKESIDEGSFTITQGTQTLSATTGLNCSNQGFYEYDQVNGELKFCVNDTSETITINGRDLYNNDLPTSLISYLVSLDTEVDNPLFFPNPYKINNIDPLKLSFSLTQLSDVDLYIYDFQGQLVYQSSIELTSTVVGNNTHEINLTESFLKPGLYICKIIAKESNKILDSKTTRLAVY